MAMLFLLLLFLEYVMITIAVNPANWVVIGSSVAQSMKMVRLPILLAQEFFKKLNILMLIDKKKFSKEFCIQLLLISYDDPLFL